MFPYTEIETKLKKSKWSKASQQSLLSVTPRLGRWSLNFLNQQTSSVGSEFNADEISEIVLAEPQWYEDIQRGNVDHIIKTVNAIKNSDDEIQKKALLSVILDIRFNKAIATLLTEDLSAEFDSIEIEFMKDLPYSEVVNMLSSRINRIYELANLQMEIKRYCYYRDILNKEDREIIEFRKALESNDQPFGSEGKTIKFWINDFLQSIASSDRSAYNVAKYATNNPSVKNLTDPEKSALSDILKLYNWFFQPYVADDEIESYESIRMGQEQEIIPAASETKISPVNLPEFDSARPTPSANINAPKAHSVSDTPPQRTAPPKNPVHLAAPTHFDEIVDKMPKLKMGVVMDPTNIKLSEEKQRLEQEKNSQAKKIQYKLEELRKRNNKQP